jgi:curved DNA-binding protein
VASKDLYKVLGVERGASQDDIRTEYRKLARKLHPDVNPGDKAAEARFKEVSAAYGVLSDEQKRKLYDEFGDVALQVGFDEKKAEQLRRMGGLGGGGQEFDFGRWSESFGGGAGGFEDILGGIFGGRFGRRGPRRGRDVQARLEVPLPLAVKGGQTTIHLQGRGPVDVKIPEGTPDGATLRLSGLGEPGEEGAHAGDLYLELEVAEHPSFRREGDDLHVEVPITVPEAVLGGKVAFAGPTGEVSLKIPPGTQSGRSFRLRGLGAKGKDGERGNLYVKVLVVLPEAGGERLEAAAKELQALYQGDPRSKISF